MECKFCLHSKQEQIMKIKLLAILILTVMSGVSYADCMQGAKVAEKFMQSYIIYLHNSDYQHDALKKAPPTDSFEQWLHKNRFVSENFKKSYRQLLAQAMKEDPELGLDFDPVFNAQDYPDKGFKIMACDEKMGLITFVGKSKDWASFKVYAKVLKKEKAWLVDGMGAINMSERSE
jgi:hypothetical protein